MRSFLEGILKKIEARASARLAQSAGDQPAPAAVREDFLADALIERGNKLEDEGDVKGALRIYRQAAEQSPQYSRVHLNVGNALRLLRQFDDARAAYERAQALDPQSERAALNLGNVFLDLREFAEAERAYREALALRADWAPAWLGLGCALEEKPDADGAEQAYRRALELEPEDVRTAINLAALLRRSDRNEEASRIVRAVLEREPEQPMALRLYAGLLLEVGDAKGSVEQYRRALAADPEDLSGFSDLLLTMNYLPDISPEELLEEHRRFGERLAGVERVTPRVGAEHDRPLRIGFVSADFRGHPVSFFIAPLWRELDRRQFQAYAYYNFRQHDAITERLHRLADVWRDIAGVDDDAVARQVVDDRIDILIDLSGHTGDNRLAVFARRPAPVQMTWLGYLATTGLTAIDARVCDRFTDPAELGAERWQVERPARLPNSQWCYEPQIDIPEPSSLPRRSRGFWTFGSFNQATKLGPQVLQSWIAVLNAFPDSRLRVVGVTIDAMRDRILRTLEAGGIDPARVELSRRLEIEEYFAAYREVDVALDSFPYNGGTTTCDALIMGVPVATVEGARSIARGGVSLLSNLGLSDWIARSPQELPALLQRQLADVERIASLRATLPDRMRASPLMDARQFARDFERLLRDAWTSR